MKFLLLDCSLADDRVTTDSLHSQLSAFEFDVVLWDVRNSYRNFTEIAPTFRGLPSLGEDATEILGRALTRRTVEFSDFIQAGRSVVIFVPGDCSFYYDTGTRSYSGTGKNRHVTEHVKKGDMLRGIPAKIEITPAVGRKLQGARNDFAELISHTRENWMYRSFLETSPGVPLAYVAGTNKVVGSIQQFDSGGRLILLPDFYAGPHPLDETDEDLEAAEDDDTEVDGAAASLDVTDGEREATARLLDWLESVCGSQRDELPPWARSLRFHEGAELDETISKLEKRIADLNEATAEKRKERSLQDDWMRLVSASGGELEDQVRLAFQVFGFDIDEAEVGRRDLRVSYGGRDAVVEIKGVTKSAAESNSAQLEKWASEALQKYGHEHKPILVVNGWRKVPLLDRSEQVFPDQMLRYATARDHCLVTGAQLLLMARAVLAGRCSAVEIAETLLTSTGRVEAWQNLADAFDLANVKSTADPGE